MIKNALIGHSGFIGNNIKQQMNFTSFYNSKNIFEIKNEEFDLLISCGNSSLKWKANINPIEDQNNIESFIDNIKTIKVKKFVLISTIDVYKNPYNVDENTEADSDDNIPYGKNRLLLEKFIQSNFTNYLIIRLPIRSE
jgi:UDP-glucose 4-epimerase